MAAPARPMLHRGFYPGNCREQLDGLLASWKPPEGISGSLVAAAVPHAGWRYSGGVAARTLRTLAENSKPETILLFGAVHRVWLETSAVYAEGAWETPLGLLNVDEKLAATLLEGVPDLLARNPRAHDSEHSLEVEAPMIHEIFPGVPVVPIMVPPDAAPVDVGRRIARIVRERAVIAVASTDLTHYGARYEHTPAGTGEKAHAWMRDNDRRILDLVRGLDAERITGEAREHRNACGPGALAAVTAFARELGAGECRVLEHTDSHDVAEPDEPFETAVGYAGLAF